MAATSAPCTHLQPVKPHAGEAEESYPEADRYRRTGGPSRDGERRVFLPKADGGQRPLGIASLEDKIVQNWVLAADIRGFFDAIDHRLLEAAEHLKASSPPELAALAASLGYADQAHFTRDFRLVVGQTPRAFVLKLRSA